MPVKPSARNKPQDQEKYCPPQHGVPQIVGMRQGTRAARELFRLSAGAPSRARVAERHARGNAMAFKDIYALSTEGSTWSVKQDFDVAFNWDYDEGRADHDGSLPQGHGDAVERRPRASTGPRNSTRTIRKHARGDAADRGMAEYEAMSRKEKGEVRRHFQAWQISQFMQGEQGALICAAKIVTQVPDVDSKFYASTQVIDEARHVESYKRLLEKFGVAYPMTPPLQELIDQVLRDSRWDMTYLGMQVVIEGLALAAFQQIRDHAQNPLAAAVNAYVMQDESRHVAFGRLALRDYYPQLTQKERDEREQFLLEACYLMRDRFDAVEVWKTLGLDPSECAEHMYDSGFMEMFRNSLFARIVPIVKDIGLWGDYIRKGYEEMGIIGYAETDVQALQDADDSIAKRLRRPPRLSPERHRPRASGGVGGNDYYPPLEGGSNCEAIRGGASHRIRWQAPPRKIPRVRSLSLPDLRIFRPSLKGRVERSTSSPVSGT